MPYIKKITNQDLANEVGMSQVHIQRYLSGETKIKDISIPQGTKQYEDARDAYIYIAKVGVLITKYTNQNVLLEAREKKDKPRDELRRLQEIGLNYGSFIDAEFLDSLIR